MEGTDERTALYEQGLNDTQIAKRLGLSKAGVRYWRSRQGLAPNCKPQSLTTTPSKMRRLLSDLGWGARSIARYEGVRADTVADWCQRNGIHRPVDSPRTTKRRGAKLLRDLQHRIIRAIGAQLPPDIAADAAAALMLAVIEGDVPLDQIEQHGRKFGNRALNEYANAFKQRSLDENIPGTDGLRGIDLLVDETSTDWLEEMGATWH